MAKNKLLELMGSSLKNEDIASLLNLPGLIFVDDLEEAQELKKKYSSQEAKLFVDYIVSKCNNEVNGYAETKIREEFNNNISKHTLKKMVSGEY